MIIDTINDEEGICKTIKSQYGKTSAANFDRVSTFGASEVVDKTIKKVGQISNDGSQYGTVISDDGLCSTLTAGSSENINYVETVYRIRKLTPKECFRLMGYTDRDFEEAAKVNSNSQLYRQAGNAIVKQVLEAIFLQMNIQRLPKWNDTH